MTLSFFLSFPPYIYSSIVDVRMNRNNFGVIGVM